MNLRYKKIWNALFFAINSNIISNFRQNRAKSVVLEFGRACPKETPGSNVQKKQLTVCPKYHTFRSKSHTFRSKSHSFCSKTQHFAQILEHFAQKFIHFSRNLIHFAQNLNYFARNLNYFTRYISLKISNIQLQNL